MLLASSIPMTRKVLAVAVVLILSGLAPATAVIGFCAKMPCCFGQAHADRNGPSVAANDADCCTTINCYEAPSQDLTASAKARTITVATPAVLAIVAAVPAAPPVRSAADDTSPPRTTQQRLSSLSILLI